MPASSEDDSEPEIVYNGYRRVDIGNSAGHATILEEDGLVFCGYMQMQQETVHPRPPSAKPTPVIDLVSDDEDDDRRRPSAPRVSNSVSTPSSSGSSMAPHAASPGRDDGTLVSDKVCTAVLHGRSSCDHIRTVSDICRCSTARCGRTKASHQGRLCVNSVREVKTYVWHRAAFVPLITGQTRGPERVHAAKDS